MRKLEIRMRVQVIISPTLKGSPWIIPVSAIDLNQLVEGSSCMYKALVTEMVSQNQEELSLPFSERYQLWLREIKVFEKLRTPRNNARNDHTDRQINHRNAIMALGMGKGMGKGTAVSDLYSPPTLPRQKPCPARPAFDSRTQLPDSQNGIFPPHFPGLTHMCLAEMLADDHGQRAGPGIC
ncbi:hypothetical protein BGZ63DRAFT_427966 [Mariannaea sp. PMI_226]|nr:hypothetical protein BGZ63DRAFT_427966 [Mariannaea sp. PMI_226]